MHKDKTNLSHDKNKLSHDKNDTIQNGSLDTLEATSEFALNKRGSDKLRLTKRANSKYFTNSYILKLIDLESPLKKKYWDTYHCTSDIAFDGIKYYSNYCKKRWCIVCARILTAKRVKTYLPIIKESFNDPYFVTLTQPNITADQLRNELSLIVSNFQKSKDNLRKSKSNPIKLKGTRNLEITFNPITNTFHPHLHCIIDGYEAAILLKKEWLRLFNAADEKGQHVRKFGTKEKDLLEAFKYSQKIISGSKEKKVYINAVDIINVATIGNTGGVRLFQTFGFTKPKVETELTPEEETAINETKDNLDNIIQIVYRYNNDIFDWVDKSTGELLTGYNPTDDQKEFRSKKVIFHNLNK